MLWGRHGNSPGAWGAGLSETVRGREGEGVWGSEAWGSAKEITVLGPPVPPMAEAGGLCHRDERPG